MKKLSLVTGGIFLCLSTSVFSGFDALSDGMLREVVAQSDLSAQFTDPYQQKLFDTHIQLAESGLDFMAILFIESSVEIKKDSRGNVVVQLDRGTVRLDEIHTTLSPQGVYRGQLVQSRTVEY
ncbi:hypothetical protein QR674_09795 [Acinetobacter chinensis]|uniref:Uncharacterized protein n=1 Tax=Acinetobacter chinensis TaxID=2004650 RepID=A0ABU3WFT6_9GAMM|nr:hypothetical protein [Acinetobacter chinensis]MDV2469278.1 hypothetical protein [Acinetobacter chinensis]